jgi:hypothetical protein
MARTGSVRPEPLHPNIQQRDTESPMPKITGSTIVKLLIACFLVGLGLTVLNLDPRTLMTEMLDVLKQLAQWSISNFGDAISYILLGAVIVLPIWAISYLLRVLRSRKLSAENYSGSSNRGRGDDESAAP